MLQPHGRFMKLQRWDKNIPPTAKELENSLRQEGLNFYRWSDNPGVTYPWHTHPDLEVRWIISGSIKMGLRDDKEVILNPGEIDWTCLLIRSIGLK